MTGIYEPKVVIPHYDVPAGTEFRVETREGALTYRKEADGTWEVVNFEAKENKK